MSALCVIKNCPGSTRRKRRGEKIYFYKALEDQLEDWNNAIPTWNDKIKINDRVCSRHFKDSDLIKEWNFVINDKTVTMPRGRWTLRVGAIPEIFDNYVDAPREKSRMKSIPTSLVEPAGSSSSDEDFEKSYRKRPKRLIKSRSPKENSVPRSSGTGSKSTVKSRKEINGNSDDQEADWENSCNNFVNQLNTICSPPPADVSNANPAKRGRGRPRKKPLVPVMKRGRGRPPKNQKSVWLSRTPTLPKNSTRSKQGKSFSNATSEVERVKSASVERHAFSHLGNKEMESDSWSSSDHQSSSESDAKPTKRGPGIPPRKKRLMSVSGKGLLQSEASAYESDVEIVNVPDSCSEVSTDFSIHSQITIKAEKCDDGYENCDSASLRGIESNSTSDDSALQPGPENEVDYEEVVVKRETCECEGLDSEFCEPVRRSEQFSQLPNSPIHCPEIDTEVSPVDREGDVEVSPIAHRPSASKCFPSKVNLEPVQLSVSYSSEQDCSNPLSERRGVSESSVDLEDQEMQSGQSLILSSGGEELAVVREGFKEMHPPLKNQQHSEDSSDSEMDFLGFSSDEDENLVLKRGVFKDSKELAVKSTMMYVNRLDKVLRPVINKSLVEYRRSSPSNSHRERCVQSSSLEVALNQLSDSDALISSSHSDGHKNQASVLNTTPKTIESLVQGGKSSNSDSIKESLSRDMNCEEVLKCGRISNEVTVTKALNPSQRLDKVVPVSNHSLELDKVVPSSGHSKLSDKSCKSQSVIQPSMSEPNLSKVITSSNFNLNKDGAMTKTSSFCQNNEKVATSSDNRLFKDKLTISSNPNVFKDAGTSTSENGPVKDKIPSNFPGPFPDKLAHQLSGSSLDRILQSAKTSAFLDSISLTSNSDLATDKTSLLLKNFKTDGILALECVVYKEQNRQLQKELYLHREMLRKSEQQVSLLQRELDLRAKAPCTKCLNLKRGFIGKETLI